MKNQKSIMQQFTLSLMLIFVGFTMLLTSNLVPVSVGLWIYVPCAIVGIWTIVLIFSAKLRNAVIEQ
jgi:hypothetical protein